MKTSLPERSQHVAEQLAAITEVIRDVVGKELAMVILFGSYARGDWVSDRYTEGHTTYTYESDFDLLVVSEKHAHGTAQGEARLSGLIGRRLKRLKLDQPSSTVIVEDIEHLNKALQRGSYFYTDIKKEGVLLFDSGRQTLAEPRVLDPAELQQYLREDFEHWFNSASEFLDTTFDDIGKERFNKAAFELHQATERFFTAIILAFGQYRPKTHDLERLGRQVNNLNAEFSTAFPRATPEQERCFDLLKKAYIDARYKRDFAITREELDYLASRVQKLQELAKRICEEKITSIV